MYSSKVVCCRQAGQLTPFFKSGQTHLMNRLLHRDLALLAILKPDLLRGNTNIQRVRACARVVMVVVVVAVRVWGLCFTLHAF